MRKFAFLLLVTICVSSVSAQTVIGSFEKNGREISLLSDGRWGVVVDSEVKCGDFPYVYACLDYATEFSEEASLAPIDLDLSGATFADSGMFAGRTWGEGSSDIVQIARGFMKDLSSGYSVPGERVRLLSTEAGTTGNHQYYRYEFLIDLENGPLWSTLTRLKEGSRTADIGTHVFGEIWTISPEMLAVRKDFHNRLLRNLPLNWVDE